MITAEVLTSQKIEFSKLLEPVLAAQLENEIADLMNNPKLEASGRKERGHGDPEGVFAYTYSVESLQSYGLAAIPKVIERLDRLQGYNVTFNCQKPGTKGLFHSDTGAETPMYVVQASDGGYFDVAPNAMSEEEAEKFSTPIEVNAGDVITQHDTSVLHRGRNPSDHNRYNMVVWKFSPFASLEDILAEGPIDFGE